MARTSTTEEFIAKARALHGDRYDYSLVKYTKAHDPVTIICPEHGEFVQKAYVHLNTRGCPTCGRKIVEQSRSPSQAEFLSRVLEKYGNRFGMAKAVYQSSHGPITVSCPVHGEFTTTPNRFLHPRNKYGCGQCGNEASGAFHAEAKLKTTEQFIEEAKAVHGDWYDYSKVEYVGTFCDVTIVCPVHGEFTQEARVHLMGSGCTPCAALSKSKSMSLPKEEFLRRATELYGDRYDYSMMEYENTSSILLLRCTKHDHTFRVKALGHIQRYKDYNNIGGCQKCREETNWIFDPIPLERFLHDARELYGDLYTYENYESIKKPVTVICPTHGRVEQIAYVHLRGGGCPVCSRQVVATGSREERAILALVQSFDPAAVRGDRTIIRPLELDIVSEASKLAIEYCGLYWHSDVHDEPRPGHGSSRHLNKLEKATAAGYRLITIFGDEWTSSRHIVTSLLTRLLSKEKLPTIGARSCELFTPSWEEAAAFYNQYHLQGATPGTVHLGLRKGDLTLAVMTVGKRSLYGKVAEGDWEMIRFCLNPAYNVPGAMSKLCAWLPSHLDVKRLFSFVDRRWFTGSSYVNAGFTLVKTTEPGYWYTQDVRRESRYKYAKHKLAGLLENFDPALTEVENMKNHGWNRIFDCGQYRFEKTY